MAQRPMTVTPQHRVAVTGAVMMGMLIASLALAYTLKVRPAAERWAEHQATRQVQVGELSLQVPEAWAPDDSSGNLPGFDAHQWFGSGRSDLRLLIAQLPPGAALAPIDALTIAMFRLLDDDAPESFQNLNLPTAERHGRHTVLTFEAITQSRSGIVQHTLALITTNGRQYWLIDVQQTRDSQRGMMSNAMGPLMRRDVRRMYASARTDSQRAATGDDFAAANLPATPNAPEAPVTLKAYVDRDHWRGNPIDLVPTGGPAGLRAARIVGVIESGADDSEDPLYPANLLRQRFELATGRAPRGDELWSGRIALPDSETTLPAWRLTFRHNQVASGDQANALLRMLYYVRYGNGRGVLLELIGRQRDRAQLDQWTAPIVAWLTPISTENAYHGAVYRGQQLAERCAQTTRDQMQPTMRYYIVKDGGLPIGFGIEAVHRDADADMPWHGDALLVHVAPFSVQAAYKWRSADGGDPFYWRRRIKQQDGETIHNVHLQGDGATLRFDKDDGAEQWTAPSREAMLTPINEGYWPASRLETDALLWLTGDDLPPQPHWVTRNSKGVLLRPLMGMEGDRITFEGAGAFHSWYDVNESQPLVGDNSQEARRRLLMLGPPSQGWLLERADRQTVLDTFAPMTSQIETWEEEHAVETSPSNNSD